MQQHQRARRYAAKMGIGRIVIGGALLSGAFVPALMDSATAGASGSPLYIGSVLGVTGAFGNFAAPEQAGLTTVVKEINASGGVLGHKLVYVNVNDTSTVTKDAPAMQQLLGEHKYIAVFPTPVGFPTQLNYTNAEKTISFGGQTASSNDTFTPTKWPYDFGDSAPVAAYEEGVAQAVMKLGGSDTKLGVIQTTAVAAETQIPIMEADVTKLGGKVVGTEQVAATATDVTQQATTLQAAGANVLYSFESAGLCTSEMNAVATLHWSAKVLNNQDCLSTQEIKAVPASIKSQVKFIGVSTEVTDPKTGGPNPKIAKFSKSVLAIDPGANVSIAAVSATAVRDVVWAIKKAKSTNETKILTALQTLGKSTVSATTWIQMPNPKWSASTHTMSNATFSGYYGLITPTPATNGTFPGTVLTYKSS